MVLDYNDKKYCINCDWLQYSCILMDDNPTIRKVDGYRIELVQGNNIFRHRALVYDSLGCKWLTLLWSPYSSRLNTRLLTCQVSNELLYMGSIHEAHRLLERVIDCTFNSMGRIDLCCDFVADNDFLTNIYELVNCSAYMQGKSEDTIWRHRVSVGDGFQKMQPHCLNFGTMASEIKVKIYNKSRELGLVGGKQKSPEFDDYGQPVEGSPTDEHKPWISDEWRTAGFNLKKVWRMEFSMKGANQLRSKNHAITLDDVASSEWQMLTFIGLYNKRAVVRKAKGKRKGHKNEDEIIRLLDLPTDGNHLKWFEGNPPSHINTAAIPIIRSMMSRISEPCIMANEDNYMAYTNTIITLVENNRLGTWFKNRFGGDVIDVCQDIFQDAGTRIIEQPAEPSRFFD